MTPTVAYVESKIREFNALIFDSCLPPIPVKLSHARTFLGKVQYRKKRNVFGKISGNTDFLMRISTMFDLSEKEQEDVIIHEMIHYYIAYKGLKDSSTHGKLFRGYMDRINRDYGRNITVRHKSAPGTVNPKTQEVRAHYICVSLLQNEHWGITVCAKTKIFDLYRQIPKHYQVKQMNWYGSLDPFFNKFPRSKTPKVYKITQEELDTHLKNAQKMVCDGKTLRAI